MIDLINYRPFYFFNSVSRYNILDKSTLIKVNGISHYRIK